MSHRAVSIHCVFVKFSQNKHINQRKLKTEWNSHNTGLHCYEMFLKEGEIEASDLTPKT